MSRSRVRAAVRKTQDREARRIAQGVFTVAMDLKHAEVRHPLPIYVSAPLVYVSEMMAVALCEARGWGEREQVDRVATYVMSGLQEFTVALFENFDVEHFEAWTAALGAADSG